MTRPDLNLLITLDVLLSEGSVAKAARRQRLSPSAMSRALARLRQTLGDPLLVRAGRALVPSPRALELREPVRQLVQAAASVLSPVQPPELRTLERTFTLRTREGFVENFGPAILARVQREAPRVRLQFLPKLDKDSAPLREGHVDLDTGVVGPSAGPELRTQALFRDRFVGVVRLGHPLGRGRISVARYARSRHVVTAGRSATSQGPVDTALSALGLARDAAAQVGGFAAALALARATDLVATVPERHTGNLRHGLHSFELPIDVPPITVSLIWHPRMDGDPAHRWLRGCVREACLDLLPDALAFQSLGKPPRPETFAS